MLLGVVGVDGVDILSATVCRVEADCGAKAVVTQRGLEEMTCTLTVTIAEETLQRRE